MMNYFCSGFKTFQFFTVISIKCSADGGTDSINVGMVIKEEIQIKKD